MSYTYEDLAHAPDLIASRQLENGRAIFLRRLMFGSFTLGYSLPEDLALGIVSDEWQFNPGYMEDVRFAPDEVRLATTLARARDSFEKWDGTGEPDGWTRHVSTGRRRYNGDPATEKVLR